jgi:hypothetical protein
MQMLSRVLTTATLALLAAALPARAAQKAFAYELKNDWPLSIPKGSRVVVKIPTHFWAAENLERKNLKIDLPFKGEKDEAFRLLPSYFVNVEDVLNQQGWEASGFPECEEFILTRAFEFKSFAMHHKLPYTEVELRSSTNYLRLHFAHVSTETGALNADFQRLVFMGSWSQFESTEEFHKNIFAVQQTKIFTGPLTDLSEGVKLALMNMVCKGQNTFSTELYKGKTYFAIGLGEDTQVYNSNVMNSTARVAKVINERVIGAVKTFQQPAVLTGISGVKFAASINFRNFVNESELATHDDQLEVYVPVDLCLKFVDADITSQQLIDNSTVLLNGNRIQVPLSTGG